MCQHVSTQEIFSPPGNQISKKYPGGGERGSGTCGLENLVFEMRRRGGGERPSGDDTNAANSANSNANNTFDDVKSAEVGSQTSCV